MDPRNLTLVDGTPLEPAVAAGLIFDTDPHIFSFALQRTSLDKFESLAALKPEPHRAVP